MNDFNTSISRGRTMDASVDQGLRSFMLGVYSKLTIGIAIAGVLAFVAGTVPVVRDLVFGTPLYYVVMFAPPALIIGSMFFMKNPSPTGSAILYWAIVATVGLGLGVYFALAQSSMSVTTAGGISQSFNYMTIAKAFFITASAFAALSLWGYTTKRDLSGMGSFLMMGLIGLIVAMLINLFLASSALAFAISVIGILIFAGLTAYDTQKIKTEYLAHAHAMDSEWLQKSAIMGALSLYLDFINLFMFLLQFLGNRE